MSPEGYEFIRHLSQGAFGAVHLARRTEDGRLVAIKILRLPSDANLRRFWREANVLHQQLNNPHVVDLLEWSFDGEPAYLAMEYCAGGSLRRWVAQRRPWQQVVEALRQAAAGLEGIHEHEGFHRDLKPDNILLVHPDDGPLVVKLGDFGLARVPDLSSSGPMTRSAWGTKGYIAPELALGSPFDSRCDIYSLGVTGIELLTGVCDRLALARRTDVPQAVRELLTMMTHPDPTKRPTIQYCQRVLKGARMLPAPAVPRELAPSPPSNPGIGKVLGFLGVLAAIAAAGSMNTRDANGRFHGRDGRFRSGRWG